MKQSEYLRYDATALADLIRRGEVTSGEVCEAAVERATRVNGKLNAICYPQFSEAPAQPFPEQGVLRAFPCCSRTSPRNRQTIRVPTEAAV